MIEFLTLHNLMGLAIGISTFFIIGVFHPIVVKAEYHLGTGCWWIFLVCGIIFVILSVTVSSLFISTLAGVIAFSCFWSVLEIFEQTKRVSKGWFPSNPKRMKREDKDPSNESI
jgi:hypothetical protein